MKKTLDHVPAVVAMLALLMGLSSQPKWDSTRSGIHRLTPFGWVTVMLGGAAFAAALALTIGRQSESDHQARQRKRLRAIADAETRLALSEITYPFFTLFGDDSESAERALVPPHIQDPSKLAAIMRIDVRSLSPFDDGSGRVPWHRLLKTQADRGASRLDRVMQIYAAYLEPEVLEALSELRTSEFLVLRLQGLDVIVKVNEALKFLDFPFVNAPDMADCWGFGKFWSMMRKLDMVLDRDPTRLQRRL